MEVNCNNSTGQKTLKLLAIELLFWGSSALFNYFSVYFQSLGLSALTTGNITAINSFVGVLVIPLWGLLSDKIRSAKITLIIASIGTAIFYTLIPITMGKQGITLVVLTTIIFSSIFRSPLSPLVDNVVIRSSNRWGLNYGFLRAIGSIGTAATSIALGIIIPLVGTDKTFFYMPLFLLPMLGVILFTQDANHVESNEKIQRGISAREIFKNHEFVMFLIFNIVVSIATQSIMTFSPYLISDIGIDSSTIGIIFGWQSILQIVVLFLLKYLRQKYALYKLLIAAGFLYSIVCFSFGLSGSFLSILSFSSFAGIGSGLLIACCNNYIFEIAEDELVTTYQGLMYSAILLSGIFGNVAGGTLIDWINIRGFYQLISLLVLIGTFVYAMSFKFKKFFYRKGERTNATK